MKRAPRFCSILEKNFRKLKKNINIMFKQKKSGNKFVNKKEKVDKILLNKECLSKRKFSHQPKMSFFFLVMSSSKLTCKVKLIKLILLKLESQNLKHKQKLFRKTICPKTLLMMRMIKIFKCN
jgi:hypothetical protein